MVRFHLLAWRRRSRRPSPPRKNRRAGLIRELALRTKTAHVQGIDTDGVHLWVTSVERATRKGFLQEFAVADGSLLRTIELQDGDRYHPGGIAAGRRFHLDSGRRIPQREQRRDSAAQQEHAGARISVHRSPITSAASP